MEVRARYDGLCDPLAIEFAEALRGVDNSRSNHKVGTFPSLVDDLHIGGILPVVYPRDYPATWSVNVHSVG